MNNIKKSVMLAQMLRRNMASQTSTISESASPKFRRLKEVQAKFGVEDGVPSYLKGGFTDRVLYLVTVGLVIVGLGMSTEVIYKLAVPKKE